MERQRRSPKNLSSKSAVVLCDWAGETGRNAKAEAIIMGRQVISSRQFRRGIFTGLFSGRRFLVERAGSISQRAKRKPLEFWMEPIVILCDERGFSSNHLNSGWFDHFCGNV